MQDFQLVVSTTKNLTMPIFSKLFFLYIIFYFFAVIGEMAFGGDINQDSVQEKSPDTDNLYYLLNFNSYGASLVTLFHFMVINNWFVTIDMYEAVNGGSMFPTFYFVLFWVFVVLILLNVLIALILEIYSAVEPEIQNKTKKRALTE